jgi:ethanolamine ammonia-lyase small subunit
VSEDQKVSNPTSNIVDKDTLDTLAVASNIGDIIDTIENIEKFRNSLREKLRLG